MTWTCDQIESQLSDYIEGLLQPQDRAAFEAHVTDCAECTPLLASVRSLMTQLHSMELLEESPSLVYSILDKTLGPRETVSAWQGFRNFIRGLATPKFAYGSASVFATFIILFSSMGLSLRKPKLADLQPSAVLRNVDRKAHLVYASGVKYVSDLRVVYEIQSRLRQNENELQSPTQENAPKSAPEKEPGQSDDHTHAQPKQQNRANELGRQVELLAAQCPVMLERSIR
ncbi:MAG TPA: zf-HC2 domain-containing protein [Candidatus Acidoferrum sp.]|nr:zf-HC2 domain-containing protein [Candidatus Acidoferrum sp.]